MTTCAIISFRLGLTDGVSIVAASWADVLGDLGFTVRTVAGQGPVDVLVPGLALDAEEPPTPDEVAAALAGADLVVVENLCTIPLNLAASHVVAEVRRGRPTILHHHDPAWQRTHLAHLTDLPPDDPAWRHVTINDLTRVQFAERGLSAVTIYNGFDVHQPPGDRSGTRALLGVDDDELLVGHPVRAIPRKGIAEAVALCEALDATYWLLGEAEDGYGPELDAVLARARCRVVRRGLPHGPDVYAAPDLVAFPSTWEGFGNPPVEAAIHRRMPAVGPYPVGAELRTLGFSWLDAHDHEEARRWLRLVALGEGGEVLEHNRGVAIRHFSLDAVRDGLSALLGEAGWAP